MFTVNFLVEAMLTMRLCSYFEALHKEVAFALCNMVDDGNCGSTANINKLFIEMEVISLPLLMSSNL